jgi:hypothetical protein
VESKLGGCINFFTRIWDISASWLFLKEAGGMMVGPDGKEIRFELSRAGIMKTYPVIAGSPGIIEQLRPLFSDSGSYLGPLTELDARRKCEISGPELFIRYDPDNMQACTWL